MVRPTVREIEARLASQVEDAVLERLGYRELQVQLPGGQIVAPNPKSKELSSTEQRTRFGEQLLMELGGSYRPIIVWQIEIPRTYPSDQVRTEGVWSVKPGDEPTLDCYPLSIEKQDARWIVFLTPQRREGILGSQP